MCGIAGIRTFSAAKPVSNEMLTAMTRKIAHRGPDGEGTFVSDDHSVGLGHRRLSIIDLSTGSQPMSNAAETVRIVFNGEIYNYRECRDELAAKGYRFRTASDTEVVLALYETEGAASFSRLNGIFAFAIFDRRTNEVVLARDHFGVKPLYIGEFDGAIVFASEIKAILSCPYSRKEFDEKEFTNYLLFRFNPSPGTLFKRIRKLLPGTSATIAPDGAITRRRFALPASEPHASMPYEDAEREYRVLLEAAVKRQMVADVPVGLLLSGGVDSALVAMLMQKDRTERIKTFTVGFEGKGDFNETRLAEETARLLGTDHTSLVISEKEYRDMFFESFVMLEEPIAITSTLALYFITRLASRHLKVVLSGQGADEPLAGYPRYVAYRSLNTIGPVLKAAFSVVPEKFVGGNEQLRRLRTAARAGGGAEKLLALYSIFSPAQQDELLLQHDDGKAGRALAIVSDLHRQTEGWSDTLAGMLAVDTRLSLSDCLLLLADKVSMANSLELRVPYLDVELVAFLESLPSRYKLKGTVGKYIHKNAAAQWLPEQIVRRKKIGFATPMGQWLRNDMADFTRSLINNSSSMLASLMDMKKVNQLIDMHKSGKWNYERELYLLLSFEMWHQSFYQNA